MQVKVLGAARQVGRSAFLVKGQSSRVLLDYGALILKEPSFPMHVPPREVDAVILSHAHLDHSGGVPLFFISDGPKLFTTGLTRETTELLIEDFLKISGFYLQFEYLDLVNMLMKTKDVQFRDSFRIGEFEVTLNDAGHIPGGASILLEDGRRRLMYTGDINGRDTRLTKGAFVDFGELDMVLTESTYATADHTPRDQVEREFVEFAREVVERGGTLLVPAFAVGRAQEIACILRAAGFQHPVAMDGMALKVNELLFRHQQYIRDPELFRKAIENLELITSWSQRRRIVKTPSVIISPAGMLVGGAAVHYSNAIAKNAKNGICIVAFQVPGTPGRTLLERGMTMVNGKAVKVKAEVRRFDFSSHGGRTELFQMFKHIRGSPKVLTVHGEEEMCVGFAEELKSELGLEAVAPKVGETFAV